MLQEDGGRPNDAFSLRTHRFGAVEKAASVVLFHWDDMIHLCERVDNRNDLILFLRTVMECEFIKNMIIALALWGIHLIEPFVEMVTTSNHEELQVQLPALFPEKP